MKKQILALAVAAVLLAACGKKEEPATMEPVAAAPAPQFQNGDIVALVGDSITHGRKWHRYVYEYYLTRFPERQIRFVNQGIAGDSAGGALSRLEWDILYSGLRMKRKGGADNG